MPDEQGGSSPQQWDAYVATIAEALNAANSEGASWRKLQLREQLKDAEKGRQNSYKIAQLQAETSRYGVDVQRKTQLEQLKENQRQFDATHGLDMAKAYTSYAQTPDMMFARNDFVSALNNINSGAGGTNPIAGQGQPQAKGWADFAALAGFGNVPGVISNQTPGAVQANVPGGGGGAGAGADPRIKAMRAIGDAIPPSETSGADQQDWAALRAIESLYFAGRPGDVEKLGAPRRKIAQAGLARLGYDPATVEDDRSRSLPGQGSARAY